MKITVTIDDELLEMARNISGIEDIDALVLAALEALIEKAGSNNSLN